MALTITDKIMRSGQTPHTATPAGDGWEVPRAAGARAHPQPVQLPR